MEPIVKTDRWDPTNLASVIRHFGEQGDDVPALALLTEEADPNTADSHRMPAIYWAVIYDRPVLVEALLARGVDPDARTLEGTTPLMQCRSAAVARLLLESGAEVNAIRPNLPTGWTPLMFAAVANRVEVASVLLEFGADLHLRNARGRQALHIAARAKKLETVRLLLDHGADVGLVEAALLGDYAQTRAFLNAGADLQTDEMEKALQGAAEVGHSEIVTLLLDHGAAIDATDRYGQTALMRSTQHGRIETMRLLLDCGADPNVQTKRGTTALSMCINTSARWNSEAAETLLARGAQLRLGSLQRSTALVPPCFLGDMPMIELLLQYGADPNELSNPLPSSRGTVRANTNALMTAVKFGHTDAVQLLLQHGADPLLQNSAGKSALDTARSEELYEPAECERILSLLKAAIAQN